MWVSHFLLACQQMTVAGAVVTYYFTRDKARLPATPILSSVLRLMRYHLGTVAKGSFIITLVQVPRLMLLYLHNQLRGRVGGVTGCVAESFGGQRSASPTFSCPGELLLSLPAEDLHLLPVVSGEGPQLSQPGDCCLSSCSSLCSCCLLLMRLSAFHSPECICSHSHQQHQFLHVGP